MRILLYTGKGGVGKTSISAASALRCAEMGYRTIVVSTDPAHSLADSFDLPLGAEPTAIADRLWGQEIDLLHQMEKHWGTVQEYLAKHIRQKYEMFDVNVYQENMFHTKMHIKDFDLDTYLFEAHSDDLSFKERQRIEALVKREIEELFHGRNLA